MHAKLTLLFLREFQRTIDIALAEALDDAKQLQDRMEQCKNKELVRAVDDIRQKERSICQEKINQQRQMYEQQILALNAYLRDIEEQMDEKLRFILSLEKHIKEVEDELVEVRNAFESFISNVKPFQPDPEVQYVLPPLRTIDMSKLGRNWANPTDFDQQDNNHNGFEKFWYCTDYIQVQLFIIWLGCLLAIYSQYNDLWLD